MTFPPRPDRKLPHVIARVRYQEDPAPLACSCGWAVDVRRNPRLRDPHEPVNAAWLGHRRDVGAPSAWAGGRHREEVA